MSELELKLQVPQTARHAVATSFRRAGAQAIRLRARYFDTPDGLLGRHGLSLRLRHEGEHWVQTLKAGTAHAAERLEHNVDVDAATGEVPALDITLHRHTAAGKQLARLLKAHDRPMLVEVYSTDIERLRRGVVHEGSTIEAAFDEGRIIAGDLTRAVCEVELEFKSGRRDALFALGHAWLERHGLWLDTISKGQRGSLLAAGQRFIAPLKARPPAIDRRMDGAAVLQGILVASLSQAIPNAAEMAAGSDDAEHLHQLRVGLRRLRTALRELTSLCDAVDPAWGEALTASFRRLGAQRDRQAASASIAPQLIAAGAPLVAWPEVAADGAATAVARSVELQAVLLALLGFTMRMPDGDDSEYAPADDGNGHGHESGDDGPRNAHRTASVHDLHSPRPKDVFAKRLARLHRQVVRDAEHFDTLATADQHHVRKRLKRLRYLAEFAQPLFGKRAVQRYLEALRPAQDALGQHNDEVVAMAAFQSAAQRDPRALFAEGWLQARLVQSSRAGRKALLKVARAERFW